MVHRMAIDSEQSTRRVPRVGLLIEASRSYERGLLSGIARYSQLHGPWHFLRRLPVVAGGGRIKLTHLREWMPDGLLLRESSGSGNIASLDIPMVYAPTTKPLDDVVNVVVDDAAVGAAAAVHLLCKGLPHFAFVGMNERYFWSEGRCEGFCRKVRESGAEPHVYSARLRLASLDWAREEERIGKWISSLPTPVGLMACTDDFTLLVMEACKFTGRRIPEDVALVGVGNDPAICELAAVPVTSVALNTERSGYDAAERLDRLMRGDDNRTDIVVPSAGVVDRQSTDVLLIGDAHVARVLTYIRDHSQAPLHVDELVGLVPLSRRALYTRFERAMGEPIYKYVQRVRMERFARLLAETTLPVARIAEHLGFGEEKNVSRTFRKVKGLTPQAYRRKHGRSG